MGLLKLIKLVVPAVKLVRSTYTHLEMGQPSGLVGEVKDKLSEKLEGASDRVIEDVRKVLNKALDKVDNLVNLDKFLNTEKDGDGNEKDGE